MWSSYFIKIFGKRDLICHLITVMTLQHAGIKYTTHLSPCCIHLILFPSFCYQIGRPPWLYFQLKMIKHTLFLSQNCCKIHYFCLPLVRLDIKLGQVKNKSDNMCLLSEMCQSLFNYTHMYQFSSTKLYLTFFKLRILVVLVSIFKSCVALIMAWTFFLPRYGQDM